MSGFAEALGERLLLCDGAMGTMLHAAGSALDRALPEVNITDPDLVATIHESYLSAGADIVQTNTFGANRLWLAGHDCADQVSEINRAGARIARAAAARSGREVFVAGSVSPAVTARQRRQVGAAERVATIAAQVRALAAEGVDLIILETFGYLDELAEAVGAAAAVCDVPIVAQATFADDGRTLGGETPPEVAAVLGALPVAMIGVNCTTGPQRMLAVVESLVRHSPAPVSAQPNAGQPRRVGHQRIEFSIEAGYFVRYLRRFAEEGAVMVGGCCGTTPSHTGAAAEALADLRAARPEGVAARPGRRMAASEDDHVSPGVLDAFLASGDFMVAAELPAPDGPPDGQAADTVAAWRERGVSLVVVTAPDSPRAHRDALGMAALLQQQTGVEAVVTMTTWDKTIMTLQADLLGAHALGVRNIVCETGNPPVLGDYPAVDGVWEVDSLGLVSLLAGLNAGRDMDGLPLAARTSFRVGARINPGARDLAAEIARARAEVRAGARFLLTRPVYETASLAAMTAALADTGVPVLASVAPLRSFEEADYLAHEVPDVTIPPPTLREMAAAGRPGGRRAGLDLAARLLREARPLVGGVVLAVGADADAFGELLTVAR